MGRGGANPIKDSDLSIKAEKATRGGEKRWERRAQFITGGTGRKDVTAGKGEQRSGGANNAENPSETT